MTAFLLRAVELARQARDRGDRPFGAVITDVAGNVLAEGRNGVTTSGDIRAHAELDAVANARGPVTGGTVWASGEPCPMCAAGMVWAGVSRIVFAAATRDFTPLLGDDGPRFTLTCAEVIAASNAPIVVEGPVPVTGALDVFRA
ncbi:nucleoside deaminase [Actinoplanes sp. NBRC 101535]|uniref:nucleoside deaminase n=1 Tax=Actinoplanes sp. NBRC 101535 TaxID=3032196 RepID=UPI00249FD47A|nr:nucleoside deaminase [Actinoplanes sp. NBRC 101535]GLY02124.1 tRNA-specific adenosine deaminase [Actinoplanes sp. NBRC 101535]